MKKSLFFFAAAALALTACSNDDATQQAQATAAPQAVAFDIYTAGTTRSGDLGIQTTTSLKAATDKGFGVFAFHHDNAEYPANNSSIFPNFMYNEHVYWNNGWTYDILKYWPNETTTDSQTENGPAEAKSSRIDKLSFFAYAPYVSTGSTGTLNTKAADMITELPESGKKSAYHKSTEDLFGITRISADQLTNDPLIEWTCSADKDLILDQNVDLLWGVAPAGMAYQSVYPSLSISKTFGLPLTNMVKPDKDQKMKFLFQHALSRIGLTVVSAIDQIAAGDDANKFTTTQTRVLIEEVEVWGDFGKKGVLNLNNGTANVANWIWTSVNRTASTEANPILLINTSNDYLATDLRYESDKISTITGTVGEAGDGNISTFTTLNEGVLPSVKQLFKGGPRYFMVIPSELPESPSTPTTINVKIKYHVVTKDEKLTDYISDVENEITKTTKIQLECGKSYNLKLILGLTSVKMEATVADWQVGDDAEIWLPRNNE